MAGECRGGDLVHLSPVGALVLAGQVAFAGFLAVAVALHPGLVLKADEGGVSNYGIHLETAGPYSLAFVVCAACSLAAARRCPRVERSERAFAVLLVAYAVLLLLTLVSTFGYTLDRVLKDAHLVVGGALLVFQFLASSWLYAGRRTVRDATFLGVEVAGSVVAVLTVLGAFHLLFAGQAVAALGFGLLLIRRATDVNRPGPAPRPTGRRRLPG